MMKENRSTFWRENIEWFQLFPLLHELYQRKQMINEITINSNNAIEMSRGELLSWVNELLKTNLTKIEQLGTGAIYCQLTDVLYPGKIPMSKVNWKAKFDYQFVANFKVLQQTFTKLGVMKHIEVEKLVKCKYQDNLEMLQWFKKIFDNSGQNGRDYNPLLRRGDREKENKVSLLGTGSKEALLSNSKGTLEFPQRSNVCGSFQMSDRTDENDQLKLPISSIRLANMSAISINPPNSPQTSRKILDSSWRQDLKERTYFDERQFFLKKFKEIQHLMEDWNTDKSSSELISEIRKVIMVAPGIQWSVEQGQYRQRPLGDMQAVLASRTSSD